MTKKLTLGLAFGIFLTFFFNDIFSNKNGAPSARSGGAGEANCATSCHNGNVVNGGPGTFEILCNAPANSYTPGDTYTFTVNLTQTGIVRFGFEVLCGYSSSLVASRGTYLAMDAGAQMKKITNGTKWYVTQISAGSTGTTTKQWQFKWIAPVAGTGTVQFFSAGNAANNNGSDSGDQIYTMGLTLTENTAAGTEPSLSTSPSVHIAGSGTENEMRMILKNVPSGTIHCSILDINGRQVVESEFNTDGSLTSLAIPMENQPQGVYFAIVSSPQFSTTVKFIRF